MRPALRGRIHFQFVPIRFHQPCAAAMPAAAVSCQLWHVRMRDGKNGLRKAPSCLELPRSATNCNPDRKKLKTAKFGTFFKVAGLNVRRMGQSDSGSRFFVGARFLWDLREPLSFTLEGGDNVP
jgi:hypothetical protein